jgi:hypothetical protein
VATAQQVTLNRANGEGRGTINTVLIHTNQQITALALAADWNQAVGTGFANQYAIPIYAYYHQIEAAHGANGALLRNTGQLTYGKIWVKAYFDDNNNTIRITGIQEM